MRKYPIILSVAILWGIYLLSLSGEARAACRNPNVAEGDGLLVRPAAASGFVEVKWFGHAFFQITSSSGTRVVTDPFGNMGYPMPEVWPDVVTVGREVGNHNNVGLAKGGPVVLRGVKSAGGEWNEIDTVFRDVLIYNVPINTRAPYQYLKGSAFVFELDGLCICHTGDVGEPFNENQLEQIGHVDILLLPISGPSTMGPENAKKVLEQFKPKIAVPMHYYNNTAMLERFLDGPYQTRFLENNTFSISKETLPPFTEIFIPKVLWHGDLDRYH